MAEPRNMNIDFDAELSEEADRFLSLAMAELNLKHAAIQATWGLSSPTFEQWTYDPGSTSIRFQFNDGSCVQGNAQLIGTLCHSDDSFEWAWNNPRFPAICTSDSLKVRALGDKWQISYLQLGMVPVVDDEFLSYLLAIFLKATDSDGVFRGGGEVEPLLALKNLRKT